MDQALTVDRVAAAVDEAEARCSLRCDCWDCRAYRRHLLKVVAVVLLACGLGGEVGLQTGLWRANEASPARAELAHAAPADGSAWF